MTFCIGGTMKPLPSKQSRMCRGERSARPPCRAGGIWQNVKRRRWDCPRLHQNTIWWISWHSQAIRKIRSQALCLSRLTSSASWSTLYESFRFVDTPPLPVNETCTFCISFSKDLTFADETILFERWNYIVWRVKHKCFADETILFGRQNVKIPKSNCIVF